MLRNLQLLKSQNEVDLIPPSANIPELLVWLDARSQQGVQGTSISFVSDQTNNISGITASGVTLNIAAGGIKEWDFRTTANNPRINLGEPSILDFNQTDNWSIGVITGSIGPVNSSTYWSKHLNTGGLIAENALFHLTSSSAFSEIFTAGDGKSYAGFGTPINGSFVVLTYQWTGASATTTLWINGVSRDSATQTSSTKRPGSNWYLGIQQTGSGWESLHGGTMKAFGIWNKVLTGTEQLNIYNQRFSI